MSQKIPTIDPSAIANTKSGIGGIAVIFTTAMATITVLILNKAHLSEDAFLLTLIAILVAGAGASLYTFYCGTVERMLRLAAETKQNTTEILQESRTLSAILEKQRKELDKAILSLDSVNEESTSGS